MIELLKKNDETQLQKYLETSKKEVLFCISCKITLPNITIGLDSKRTESIYIKIKCPSCKYDNSIKLEQYIKLIKCPKDDSIHYCNRKTDHETMKLTANLYCYTCQKWICDHCFQDHQSYYSLNNHIYVSREIKMQFNFTTTPRCLNHFDKFIKFNCNDCKKKLCRQCYTNEHITHSTINLSTLDTEFNKFKNQLNDEENGYYDLINIIDKQIMKLTELRNWLQQIYDEKKNNDELIKTLSLIAISDYTRFKLPQSLDLILNIDKVYGKKSNDFGAISWLGKKHQELVQSFMPKHNDEPSKTTVFLKSIILNFLLSYFFCYLIMKSFKLNL